MYCLTVSILSVVTFAAAFTPPPNMLWQPDPMHQANQWGMWDQPLLDQIMMPPIAEQAPINIAQNQQKVPHISLDELIKLVNPGFVGMGGTGGAAGIAQIGGQFNPFLHQHTTPKNTTITTTTTTTPKPITTTATTTTTTTTQKPTTRPRPTTWSPNMKLSDILKIKAQMDEKKGAEKSKPSATGQRGCFDKGKYYAPLTQVERGQVGDWCWGSYCNHESKIIHWDDHKCNIPTTPPTTTQDPNQFGCEYNGRWYTPGADIDNWREYGKCFGMYCDYDSRVQRWEDRCTATIAPPTGPGAGPGGMGMSAMAAMVGMSDMAGMAGMGGMNSMGGMSGMAGMMEGMGGMGGAGGAGGSMSRMMSMLSKKK